ncbi:DNA sulfur modification protein DndB [Bacillus sp. II_CA]|uniref:DNA sulfur modification protein DndB n=1 Tax=Bacillus sp. II_CA TaxID=3417451 RepID=UPI003CFB99FC
MSQYIIDAIRYQWQNKSCYVGNMKYSIVPYITDLKSDLSMNRDINEKRVTDIVTYLTDKIGGTFFPPVILSSHCTMEYNDTTNKLTVKDGKFTIIDGQHRISAINSIIDDPTLNKKYKNICLPVLIVEGLENHEHRNLFNTINKKAKVVDSNIAIRFTPNLENLLGLRFFTENRTYKGLIEWEKQQSFSKDKVAYIHLTECIKEINKHLSSSKLLANYFLENDNENRLLYTHDDYYLLIKLFLNKLLNFIKQNPNELEFYTTKAYLRAIADEVCETIKKNTELDKFEDASQMIDKTLNSLFKEIFIPYNGKKTSSSAAYLSIRSFLKVNTLLIENKQAIQHIKPLINAYLNCFYSRGEMFELQENDFENIRTFILGAAENTTALLEFDEQVHPVEKQTSIDSLLRHLASQINTSESIESSDVQTNVDLLNEEEQSSDELQRN